MVLRLFSVQFVDTVIFKLRNAKLRVQARRFRGQTNLLVQVGNCQIMHVVARLHWVVRFVFNVA